MTNLTANPLLNMTLGNLQDVAAALGVPGLPNLIKRHTLTTYQEFVDVLYNDINEIVAILQENPELRKEDEEDRLTIEIVGMLKTMGYNADHERKVGGHTDISVRGRSNFLWIGEAKIHSSYGYLFEGFQQLCTRYAVGDVNQNCGGLLIYIRNRDASNVISTWKERITGHNLEDLVREDCAERPNMVFYTTHKLDRSGQKFYVKHIGISLHFDPKDHIKAA